MAHQGQVLPANFEAPESTEPSLTRSELRERLRAEVRNWEQKTFQDLAALTYPVTCDTGAPGEPGFFEIEVTVLEQTPEYVHLVVAVSDGGVSAFSPVTEDVMVRAAGTGWKPDRK